MQEKVLLLLNVATVSGENAPLHNCAEFGQMKNFVEEAFGGILLLFFLFFLLYPWHQTDISEG